MTRVGIAILIGACAAILAGCAKSPEATVEGFYMAVSKGEITEAQGYLSSQIVGMLGANKVAGALAAESEKVRRCGGIKSIDVKLEGQGEVRSGTAKVMYGGACQQKNERVKLLKEDGKWKISADK